MFSHTSTSLVCVCAYLLALHSAPPQKASDRFLVAHFVGWFVKTLMIRDPLMCHVLSFLFEILEYLFTHVQPNFAECWWDHVRVRPCA
jgi:hypothetical protein